MKVMFPPGSSKYVKQFDFMNISPRMWVYTEITLKKLFVHATFP